MPRKKNSGLGRGLDAIFLDNSHTDDAPTGEGMVIGLKLSLIDPRADQPRKSFDEEKHQAVFYTKHARLRISETFQIPKYTFLKKETNSSIFLLKNNTKIFCR